MQFISEIAPYKFIHEKYYCLENTTSPPLRVMEIFTLSSKITISAYFPGDKEPNIWYRPRDLAGVIVALSTACQTGIFRLAAVNAIKKDKELMFKLIKALQLL